MSENKKKCQNILGTRLREMREKTGLSQVKAAKLIKLNPMSVLNYETGKRVPDAVILSKFAKKYGCSTDYLVGFSDTPSEEEKIKSDRIQSSFVAAVEHLPYFSKIELMDAIDQFIFICYQIRLSNEIPREVIAALSNLIRKHTELATDIYAAIARVHVKMDIVHDGEEDPPDFFDDDGEPVWVHGSKEENRRVRELDEIQSYMDFYTINEQAKSSREANDELTSVLLAQIHKVGESD